MKITDRDIRWLRLHFPNLYYDANSHKILGELDFCAVYDQESGKVTIANLAEQTDFLIQDVFEIEIYLDDLDMNGWTKVFEVGGKYRRIAEKCEVPIIDLHIYPHNRACCLGLKYRDNQRLCIEDFLHELVIPFFYRLSYTDKFGIDRARKDLWGEYSHGDRGEIEHYLEIMNIVRHNPSRNDPCPCGSGKKYKKCHLGEVESPENPLRRTSLDASTRLRR
jgi:hypothetical protein